MFGLAAGAPGPLGAGLGLFWGAPGGHLGLHEGSRGLLGAPPLRKVSKSRGFCEVETDLSEIEMQIDEDVSSEKLVFSIKVSYCRFFWGRVRGLGGPTFAW